MVTIVDPCPYGRLGLQCLLAPKATAVGAISVGAYERVERALAAMPKNGGAHGASTSRRCLVVRLSMYPSRALQQLLQLDDQRMRQAGIERLIVLSPFEVNNVVRQTLMCCGVRLPVRIVNARSPLQVLQRVVLSEGTLLQLGRDERLPQMPALLLSPCERRVISNTLLEVSIPQQAWRQRRQPKTLYAQRHNALLKLRALGLAALLRRFRSM
ncbi:hypothetical protein [Serratia nevei]|uniref:hypothetical protein n=1 Tax=Serratia nevei TaxID=2703794 RepID=UPI003F7669F8